MTKYYLMILLTAMFGMIPYKAKAFYFDTSPELQYFNLTVMDNNMYVSPQPFISVYGKALFKDPLFAAQTGIKTDKTTGDENNYKVILRLFDARYFDTFM